MTMKVILQRISEGKVVKKENGEIVGQINKGLFVLLGIKKGDTKNNADFLVEKISKLRIMSDGNDKMNLSILDTKLSVLVVSQFTLYANTKDGNRPSFIDAEEPENANILYEYFVEKLKEKKLRVEKGSFGNYMEIEVKLDGPVTIILEN